MLENMKLPVLFLMVSLGTLYGAAAEKHSSSTKREDIDELCKHIALETGIENISPSQTLRIGINLLLCSSVGLIDEQLCGESIDSVGESVFSQTLKEKLFEQLIPMASRLEHIENDNIEKILDDREYPIYRPDGCRIRASKLHIGGIVKSPIERVVHDESSPAASGASSSQDHQPIRLDKPLTPEDWKRINQNLGRIKVALKTAAEDNQLN